MESRATVSTAEADGLYEAIQTGATLCTERDGGVGRIELEARDADAALRAEIDFAYSDGRRVIDSLETRVIGHFDGRDRAAVFSSALSQFGGTGLTNFVAGDRGECDLTLSFGSKIPFLCEMLLLWPDRASDSLTHAFGRALDALHVSHRKHGDSWAIPRRSLRRPLTLEEQLTAYRALRESGTETTLYAARLPCSQAVRIAEKPDTGGASILDLTLSRGLTPSYTCTEKDAREMEALLKRELGLSFGGRSFELVHFHGTERAETTQRRRGLKWFARGN